MSRMIDHGLKTVRVRREHRYAVAAILDDNGFTVGRVAVSIAHPCAAGVTGPTFATMEEARDAAAEQGATDTAAAEDRLIGRYLLEGMSAEQAYYLAECIAAERSGR